jgi:hypothetical protein
MQRRQKPPNPEQRLGKDLSMPTAFAGWVWGPHGLPPPTPPDVRVTTAAVRQMPSGGIHPQPACLLPVCQPRVPPRCGALPDTSPEAISPLHFRPPLLSTIQAFSTRPRACGVGGGALRKALAAVRRPNGTCGFPACSCHADKTPLEASDGISEITVARPSSPYRLVSGRSVHPQHRQRWYRWDQSRWTSHRARRLQSRRIWA